MTEKRKTKAEKRNYPQFTISSLSFDFLFFVSDSFKHRFVKFEGQIGIFDHFDLLGLDSVQVLWLFPTPFIPFTPIRQSE